MVVARLDQWAPKRHSGTAGSCSTGMALLDWLDLAGPPEARLAGVRLMPGAAWPAEELMHRAKLVVVPSTLPLRRDIPLLLHGIWLGGSLRATGETGRFAPGSPRRQWLTAR